MHTAKMDSQDRLTRMEVVVLEGGRNCEVLAGVTVHMEPNDGLPQPPVATALHSDPMLPEGNPLQSW